MTQVVIVLRQSGTCRLHLHLQESFRIDPISIYFQIILEGVVSFHKIESIETARKDFFIKIPLTTFRKTISRNAMQDLSGLVIVTMRGANVGIGT